MSCSVLSAFNWCPQTDYCCCRCCCSVKAGSILIGAYLTIACIIYISYIAIVEDLNDYIVCYDLSLSILTLIIGVLILIGVCANLLIVIKISLILLLVLMPLYFVLGILGLVEMVNEKNEDRASKGSGIMKLLNACVCIAFYVYFFIIVFSHYRNSKEELEE